MLYDPAFLPVILPGRTSRFLDGHAAWYKYSYAVTPINGNNGLKPGDAELRTSTGLTMDTPFRNI